MTGRIVGRHAVQVLVRCLMAMRRYVHLPDTTAKLTSIVAGIMIVIMSYGISGEWLSKTVADTSKTMAATQTLASQSAADP